MTQVSISLSFWPLAAAVWLAAVVSVVDYLGGILMPPSTRMVSPFM